MIRVTSTALYPAFWLALANAPGKPTMARSKLKGPSPRRDPKGKQERKAERKRKEREVSLTAVSANQVFL